MRRLPRRAAHGNTAWRPPLSPLATGRLRDWGVRRVKSVALARPVGVTFVTTGSSSSNAGCHAAGRRCCAGRVLLLCVCGRPVPRGVGRGHCGPVRAAAYLPWIGTRRERLAAERRRCLTGAECGREGPAVHPATRCVRFESVPSSARHRPATAMGVRPFHSPCLGAALQRWAQVQRRAPRRPLGSRRALTRPVQRDVLGRDPRYVTLIRGWC